MTLLFRYMRRHRRVAKALILGSICLTVIGCGVADKDGSALEEGSALDAVRRQQCVAALRNALHHEDRWAKVHAAEFLTALDYRDGVHDTFLAEQEVFGGEPEYRVGVQRVLANLNRHDETAYQEYVARIWQFFADVSSPDRIHAIESLAKLNYQFPPPSDGDELASQSEHTSQRSSVQEFARGGPEAGRAYAWWVLMNNAEPNAEASLRALLGHPDAIVRQTAAYVLRHRTNAQEQTAKALVESATSEAKGPQRVYLLSAAYRHRRGQESDKIKAELLELLTSGTAAEQFEVSRLAADVGDAWQASLIATFDRTDTSPDVRSSIAHAICRIDRRRVRRMSLADGVIVGVYGIVLVGVGVYFARRTSTAGEFLLGGRAMSSWAVGLSLFATLLSTLSYLAWPGEMIKHGPVIFLGAASYPLVYFVAGWFLVPQLMQLEVTSAYEILEKRLGVSVRLLGSFLFLSLRFLWMASIIYWTTTIVLLPATGLDSSYAQLFIILIGVVTIIYTTLGGLRAVIVTDVIQTFILFAGALITMLIVSYRLGGVSEWFPNHWPTHWEPIRYWFDFDPNARATLANAMLGVFTWHVCTAGSDQMAIQRYLSTRDVKAARRSLAVSLLTDMIALTLLSLTGLALLSYFSAHPEGMADGQTIFADADKLFPRFVVVGLPVGLSGLVIAGLLAAAMSSLSSGVNSSAAVISEDFVRRLMQKANNDQTQVRIARLVSVAVGIIVVLLSTLVQGVQGNMFEVIYKVVNLFVAPLFFLFFMAIFVSRANAIGTWAGAIAGIATAFLIAFWKDLFGVQGISFLWIMPGSLVVSVCTGYAMSLILTATKTKTKTKTIEDPNR